MILLILLDGSPFLIIGNFIEGIIFIMINLQPTTSDVEGFNLYYFFQLQPIMIAGQVVWYT